MDAFLNYLPIIVVTALMAFLFAQSKKEIKSDEAGNLIFRLPKAYAYIGWFAILAGLAVLVFGMIYAKPEEKIWVLVASAVGLLMGWYVVVSATVAHLRLTEEAITQVTIFKREKTIVWDQISEVKYAVQRRELRIFSSNQKITAPLHLVGFPQLIKEIEVKTGESLAHLNIPK